jgi:hypothetical protein
VLDGLGGLASLRLPINQHTGRQFQVNPHLTRQHVQHGSVHADIEDHERHSPQRSVAAPSWRWHPFSEAMPSLPPRPQCQAIAIGATVDVQ